ncbi:UNVERIFIED_CONTAM: hypothetical protein Sangu_3121100 [Sesamum angustifolium]|uniref:Uncharacterized protein n=1 Tax=Sesamum angustifolium TaxID=2727405 RepID=A0AAW2K286_9LAMI
MNSPAFCGILNDAKDFITESPFTLSYRTEIVAPTEIRELSWRVKHYDLVSNVQGLRMNVDFIDEAREIAMTRVAMYKARMAKAYNARVRPRNFQVGIWS